MRTTSALLMVAALGTPLAEGYYKYVALIPNGGNVPDSSNIGHLTEDGTTGLNDFGEAFETAGNEWNSKLCQEDTDGDGYTNGQELGDPCCTWTTTNTAGLVTDGISHPSDASKVPTSAKLLAGCTSSSTTSGSTNSTSGEDINDVLAPVSAGSSSAMPADDDEDDSDEMAEITGSTAASAKLHVMAALVSAAVAALAL